MNEYLKDNLILGDSLENFFWLNYATFCDTSATLVQAGRPWAAQQIFNEFFSAFSQLGLSQFSLRKSTLVCCHHKLVRFLKFKKEITKLLWNMNHNKFRLKTMDNEQKNAGYWR